jgi:hypothetical protein
MGAHLPQVDGRWFLFMTGEEGMRQARPTKWATWKAAAPATVTGEVPWPLADAGKAGAVGPEMFGAQYPQAGRPASA